MNSHVNLFATAQNSVPLAAKTKNAAPVRKDTPTRETDSFQSHVDNESKSRIRDRESASRPNEVEDRGEHNASSEQPENHQGLEDEDSATAPGAGAEHEQGSALEDAFDETRDYAAGIDDETSSQLDSDLAAKAFPQEENGDAPELQRGDKKTVSFESSTKSTPVWFEMSQTIGRANPSGGGVQAVTAPNMGPQIPANQLVDARVFAKADDVANANRTGAERVEGRVNAAPGLQVKAAVSSETNAGHVNIAALANAPGLAKKSSAEPDHVAERRANAEAITAPTQPQKLTGATAAVATPQFQTVPAQKPALNAGQSDEADNIRWSKEISFSTNVASTEMPATSRLQQAALLQQPDLPRHIAAQLAQGMRQGSIGKPMELVLSPAELGRVRISMSAGDGAMTVHVVAERPETLDLMRRHIDILAQGFHDIGYGSANFAFGQSEADGGASSDSGSGSDNPSQSDQANAPESNEALMSHPALSIETDRVDIRL